MNFFLAGIYLAVIQIELFTAFLWLVECSVLFVFLLLLFFLNVKGIYYYNHIGYFKSVFILFMLVYLLLLNPLCVEDGFSILGTAFFLLENYYEGLSNFICNDLVGFSISYYLLSGFEFLLVGFLLLVGSVICVNLYSVSRLVRTQNFSKFLNIFNFFLDFTTSIFIRRQNLVKQASAKAALKLFKKI
jgi:hypothetical protein